MRIECPNCHHGLEIVPKAPGDAVLCPSCGSQLDVSSATETTLYRPETRRTIGHFELLEQVGQGHFGTVWRARDTQLKRIVAVKIPRTSDLSPADKDLFLREAQTAAKLRHPNIVTVYEVGHEGGAIFIVSDFIPGITLAEQIHARPPSSQEAAQWCAAVADALDYAHSSGVIHRDMKPGNVMLEKDKPYVLDFGLAKHEASDFTITTEGEILGTPAYMSPEQARGDSGSADRRSDVYSLGTVLYELLTGVRPFQGGSRALMHQILHDDPPPPRKLKKEIPRDLETICLRAMAKEPSRRYITAKEMGDDLRRYLAGEPIHARPVRWPERSWRWARRNPSLSTASGVAALAVLLLMIQAIRWLVASPEPARGPLPQTVHLTILKRLKLDPDSNKVPAENPEVVFWRLDPQTGDPDLERPVRTGGKSELDVKLVPGDYLVVVNIKGHGFHEVYRHVPGEGEGIPNAHNHTWAEREPGGAFKVPSIEIPPEASVNLNMVPFPAIDHFSMGLESVETIPVHDRAVRAFLLDSREVTISEFGRYYALHDSLKGKPEISNHAVRWVMWHYAVAYAEKLGKRLPEEVEYEAAATNNGNNKYPWGNDSSLIQNWRLGKVETPDYDKTAHTPAPVFGLYSNVAEWTSTWSALYPRDRKRGAVNLRARDERIIRGAPSAILEGREFHSDEPHQPRDRQAYPLGKASPGVGFRCARSVRPRLTPEDFSVAIESQ